MKIFHYTYSSSKGMLTMWFLANESFVQAANLSTPSIEVRTLLDRSRIFSLSNLYTFKEMGVLRAENTTLLRHYFEGREEKWCTGCLIYTTMHGEWVHEATYILTIEF